MPKQLSNVLTSLTVKNAKPGRHVDGGGLHLLVKESGARSWVFRYMIDGRARDFGLGAASGPKAVSLADARIAAADQRKKVQAGIDPLQEREREAAEKRAAAAAEKIAAVTFRMAAEGYLEKNERNWRNPKHRQQWRNTLETYAFPVIGELPVGKIETPHILEVLEPIWRDKRETASRLRGRIETVLNAAKVRGYRSGENPARWRGHLEQALPEREKLSRRHHAALAYDAVPAFIADLRRRKALAALALEFTILTAARTGEVIGAHWQEVDLAKGVWVIPAERMKAKREHRVPLSRRAIEILETVKPVASEWVFPNEKGGKLSSMAMAMLLRRMKVDATVHGFRSAFRDWVAEQTGYAHDVAEMALAHTIKNDAEAAYRRGDLFEKRRRMMNDWAAFCARGEAQPTNVTPIRGAAA